MGDRRGLLTAVPVHVSRVLQRRQLRVSAAPDRPRCSVRHPQVLPGASSHTTGGLQGLVQRYIPHSERRTCAPACALVALTLLPCSWLCSCFLSSQRPCSCAAGTQNHVYSWVATTDMRLCCQHVLLPAGARGRDRVNQRIPQGTGRCRCTGWCR